jgi:hypothetical protein
MPNCTKEWYEIEQLASSAGLRSGLPATQCVAHNVIIGMPEVRITTTRKKMMFLPVSFIYLGHCVVDQLSILFNHIVV